MPSLPNSLRDVDAAFFDDLHAQDVATLSWSQRAMYVGRDMLIARVFHDEAEEVKSPGAVTLHFDNDGNIPRFDYQLEVPATALLYHQLVEREGIEEPVELEDRYEQRIIRSAEVASGLASLSYTEHEGSGLVVARSTLDVDHPLETLFPDNPDLIDDATEEIHKRIVGGLAERMRRYRSPEMSSSPLDLQVVGEASEGRSAARFVPKA